MKKARIILSAVAVFAVIGGAFAFKAARTPKTFFHTTVAGGLCTVPTTLFYTPTTIGGTVIPYSTTATNLTSCETRVTLSE